MIDIVEFAESYLGFKLKPYQKLMLKACVERKELIFMGYGKNFGKVHFLNAVKSYENHVQNS